MSNLIDLKAKELDEALAFYYGEEEVPKTANKKEKVDALEEVGVTWEVYKTNFPDVEEEEQKDEEPTAPEAEEANSEDEVEEEEQEDVLLLKMERTNHTYETHGYTFRRDHPFVAIPESVADQILRNEKGFRQASPSEAKEFYG